jgi:hypothetical protein
MAVTFPLRPDLEAQLIRYEVRRELVRRVKPEVIAAGKYSGFTEDDIYQVEDDVIYLPHVDVLADAHGLMFLCPKCFAANGGPVGTHSIIAWFEDKVPDNAEPVPGRWYPQGTGYGDLSFVPHKKSNSILLTGGCQWHGFVTNGQAG